VVRKLYLGQIARGRSELCRLRRPYLRKRGVCFCNGSKASNCVSEGRSNKSWPMFQLQDFDLRGVSPMTSSPKNFEIILEQSQTSEIDYLKV